MAIYFITQFHKPRKHKAGYNNKDIGQIGQTYSTLNDALKALYDLMDKHRLTAYLRLDRNVKFNAIAYADLDTSGGVVRFRQRDNIHFSSQISLVEFKEILARREQKDALLHNPI
jgi:hypothetical protein